MSLVHVILLDGTNNVQIKGLTAHQIHLRSIGSRLVLASRIFYAMFIWVSKVTVSEFLKRLARASWKQSHQRGLYFIRIFLVVTFCVVFITTLSECQPFDHYWQVTPDPGPRCRQGFAQLISMGAADIVTDILLVIWPIPIIVRSRMPLKRKLSTVILFSLSLILIGITGTRVPMVISHQGRQQYRTVWASVEILASAAVSNAVVLGSFVRDRGIKRNKYKRGITTVDSIDRVPTRRPTVSTLPNDSDEDLFRAMGCRFPPELCEPVSPIARPAPVALPSGYFMTGASPSSPLSRSLANQLGAKDAIPPLSLLETTTSSPHDSVDALPKPDDHHLPLTTIPSSVRRVSFFDVGGLLEDQPSSYSPSRSLSSHPSLSTQSGVAAHDFASSPAAVAPPRMGFRNPFSELGDRLSPALGRRRSSQRSERVRTSNATAGERPRASNAAPVSEATEMASASAGQRRSLRPMAEGGEDASDINLQDVGGLLR